MYGLCSDLLIVITPVHNIVKHSMYNAGAGAADADPSLSSNIPERASLSARPLPGKNIACG